MATAFVDPAIFVIFSVIHRTQDVHGTFTIDDTANQAIPIIADVEHNAVPDLIGGAECLLEFREIAPISILGQLMPCQQVAPRSSRIFLATFPEFT